MSDFVIEKYDYEFEIRFLADAMLGKLAKYLRICGFDTAYRTVNDEDPVQWARKEGRILLTRNRNFFYKSRKL